MRNFNVGNAAADRDRADVHVAVVYPPAFPVGVGIAAAGEVAISRGFRRLPIRARALKAETRTVISQ